MAAVDQGNDVVKGRAKRMPRPKPEDNLLMTPGTERTRRAVQLDQALPWPAGPAPPRVPLIKQ